MKILMLIVVASVHVCRGLPTCTDPWLDFKGYTYSVDPKTNQRIWSHCKFPNPTADLSRCRYPTSSGSAYICDPDSVLNSTTNAMVQINNQLVAIQQNTSTLCESSDKQRQSYIVAIALIDNMRIADLQDTNSCINDCNEIQPTLNVTARTPSENEVNIMMDNFADSLRSLWGIGACGNDVVVFYSKQYNKVSTSVGFKAASLLTESKLAALQSTFLKYVNEGRLDDGLLVFVEDIRSELRSFTPAHIVLVICMSFLVLLVVFLVFFLHLSDVELNVWGSEKQWHMLDIVVKFVTGVWILHAIFMGITNVLGRLNLWAAAVCILAAVGCFAIYLQEELLYPSRQLNQNYDFSG